MRRYKPFARSLFSLFLLACLLTGLAGMDRVPVQAASSNIIISQIYGGGGNSGAPYKNDFVELFNLGPSTVNLGGWSIQYASATGSTWGVTNLSGDIAPGQFYLVQLAGGTTGSDLPTPDITGTTDMSATAGKVALVGTTTALTGSGCPFSASVIDFVGFGTTADCREGGTTTASNAPAPSNTTAILRNNLCTDTDNNSTSFTVGVPNPRNLASQPRRCLVVTNVTSQVDDSSPFTVAGTIIDIEVTFSDAVNVTGSPRLALNSGREAVYVPAPGSTIVVFRYTTGAGDYSPDLDYVSSNSLLLNGGTITGAIGDAILRLPDPGNAGSLGANKDIIINIDDGAAPTLVSIRRQNPLLATPTTPTRADNLTFRVTFSESVQNVNSDDFVASAGTINTVTTVNNRIYDVTVGMPSPFDGVVGLNINPPTQDITDFSSNPLNLTPATPPVLETYTVDRTGPIATITRASDQSATDNAVPVKFVITFSEAIDANTFTAGDVTLAAGSTANFITWSVAPDTTDTAKRRYFLTATSIGQNGTVIPHIAAGRLRDLVGNDNTVTTSAETVDFLDNVPPRIVEIALAPNQADITNVMPIRFIVRFSEPIVASIFTPTDITQYPGATATGVTWSVVNSGDNITFTVSATSAARRGSIIPYIAENRVTDMVGNNNIASDSYTPVLFVRDLPPVGTPTRTPTPPPPPALVAINEFLPRPGSDWNNDGVINSGDEYIELINHGVIDVNLSGYRLDDEVNIGSNPFTLPSITLKPGERHVFYGSETGLLLSDGGDGVRLLRPNGQLLDAYNYSVVQFPDQSICRLPDNGGADSWNENCYPTPGLRNSLSGSVLRPPTLIGEDQPLCPIADTLPYEFVLAECTPFGNNIWNRAYWDRFGWYGGMSLPNVDSKWDVFAD